MLNLLRHKDLKLLSKDAKKKLKEDQFKTKLESKIKNQLIKNLMLDSLLKDILLVLENKV